MLTPQQVDHILKHELQFHTSRSGGKGGQNVNKVESKVELNFDVVHSAALHVSQIQTILSKQSSKLKDGVIRISSEKHRTQLMNKEETITKLLHWINSTLKPVKKRIATKPGKAAKAKRREGKAFLSEKKQFRRKINPHD